MITYVANSDGRWTEQEAERPIVGGFLAATGFGDAVVSATYLLNDPGVSIRVAGGPFELVSSSSRQIAEDEVTYCVPAAGETCRQALFAALDRYPDFAGADFGGAELWFADFGAGDYSGASFAGSMLQGSSVDTSGDGPSFIGADFSGAVLTGAVLEDVAVRTSPGPNSMWSRERTASTPNWRSRWPDST